MATKKDLSPGEQYQHLTYPVWNVSYNDDLIREVPALNRVEEFRNVHKEDKDTIHSTQFRDNVLRYLFFMYDENSPLIREYGDLSERKDIALTEAGFTRSQTTDWSELIERVRRFQYRPFELAVAAWLRMQHKADISLLLSLEQSFNENNELLMKSLTNVIVSGSKRKVLSATEQKQVFQTAETKSKIMDIQMKTLENIETLRTKIFGGDEDLEGLEERVFITPEYMAYRLADVS